MGRFTWIFILTILLTSLLSAQNNFGIDVPLYLTKSIVLVPGAFSTIEGTGGNSSDLGIGVYYNVSESFKLKGGIHFWNKIFNPTHSGQFTLNGNNMEGQIKEEGEISYGGLYILGTLEREIFFIGGGFDIAFSNSYKSKINIYDSNNQLIAESDNNEESFLTDQFNSQFDLLLNFGFKIKLSDRVMLRPSMLVTIPFSPIFDSNITVYNPVKGESGEAAFNVLLLKYGISAEIAL